MPGGSVSGDDAAPAVLHKIECRIVATRIRIELISMVE